MGTDEMMVRAEPILDEFFAAHPGEKLNAIKEIRESLGVDLRDAKDIVDAYEGSEKNEQQGDELRSRLE